MFTLGRHAITIVLCCAIVLLGLLYSLVTNPFETAKNRMAFQKADPQTGQMLYRSTLQTIGAVCMITYSIQWTYRTTDSSLSM